MAEIEQFGYMIGVVNRGRNLAIGVFVREDKKVMISFGDDEWYTIEEIKKLEVKKGKFDKKNFLSTMRVIEKSKDYEDLAYRFFKDFKKDRGNMVTMQKLKLVIPKKDG